MRLSNLIFTKLLLLIFVLLIKSIQVQSQFKDGTFNNRNATIYYKIYGQGKPIVFIHGGPGYSSERMDSLAIKLAAYNYQVILFDHRGTGKSKVTNYDTATITIENNVADIEALLTATGNKSAIILGHSYGGILAMSFADKYPGMVDKLVLCSSGGINLDFIGYFEDNIFQRLSYTDSLPVTSQTQPVTLKEREEAFFERIRINAPAYLYYKSNVPKLVKLLTIPGSYNPDVNQLTWYDLFRNNYDLSHNFKNFTKPTLILQGRQDILGDETALTINKAFPGSKLIFIDKCGHVPWLDQPAIFLKTLTDFFN